MNPLRHYCRVFMLSYLKGLGQALGWFAIALVAYHYWQGHH